LTGISRYFTPTPSSRPPGNFRLLRHLPTAASKTQAGFGIEEMKVRESLAAQMFDDGDIADPPRGEESKAPTIADGVDRHGSSGNAPAFARFVSRMGRWVRTSPFHFSGPFYTAMR
jgi:hypothetical protein